MRRFRYRALVTLSFVAVAASAISGQPVPGQAAGSPQTDTYTVFLQSRPVGQERVAVIEQADGWVIRGSSRLGQPLDVTTRTAEIAYDRQWHPLRLFIEGTARGREMSIRTSFSDGEATSEISMAGEASTKTDQVSPDTLVLPNAFLGSYAALARRLPGQTPGAEFQGYIAPQGEVPMRLDSVAAERIETPREAIAASRYSLVVSNPPPAGELHISIWTDADGRLLRMSVPAQMLDVAREDVASAATRTTSFSIPGDETVHVPAAGFNLAASVTKPANATGRLPAIVLVGGSGPIDRDGFVAGIPVIGQMAAALVDAGFLVVRYDKRGVGQSGGRAETATLRDYADDVRSILEWLEDRDDVDRRRIGLVGHSEGAWTAMLAASRDKRVKALALVAAASITGSELVLEQQRLLLERLGTPEAEKQAKIELQQRINAAALEGEGWDEISEQLRSAADTPWFQSLLAFDPARVMRDVRQPVLILQGMLDTQVPPYHADRLAELARARRRKVATDVVKLPGLNHLLVPATTGAVDEYATLPDKQVAAAATTALADWMKRALAQ